MYNLQAFTAKINLLLVGPANLTIKKKRYNIRPPELSIIYLHKKFKEKI